MKKGYRQMVDEAEANIERVSVAEAKALVADENVVFVDIRDIRELQREGKLPGAIHAPRGMLEFWVDPDSPYYRDVFGQDKKYVFYCASAWRSALATQTVQEMGMANVSHLEGGFTAWKAADGEIEPLPEKPEKKSS